MDTWSYKPASDEGLTPIERARSPKREPGLISAALHGAWIASVRLALQTYLRLRVEGRENLPTKAPFVMVANHASHLDAWVLASPLPLRLSRRVFPIAAGDTFFETPPVALYAAVLLNALPLWRKACGPHALADLRARLMGEPCGYVLFPEGTRTRTGAMGPFKAGLGMIVAGTSVPVIPCYIQGAFEAMPSGCKLPRPRRVTLRVGAPLVFSDVGNDREGWRAVVQAAEQAVRQLGGQPEMQASAPGPIVSQPAAEERRE